MTAVPLGPGPTASAVPTPTSWWSRRHAADLTAPVEAVDPAGATITGGWAEDLWNHHGQLAYAMASALVGDESRAMRVVALGMVDLARSDDVTSADDTGRTLARHVYRRSTHLAVDTAHSATLPPAMVWLAQLAHLQRAALALCAIGGFTCTDAAEQLGITPLAVAQLLTSGLDELKRLSQPVIIT